MAFRRNPNAERELRAQPEFITTLRATTTLLAVEVKAAAPRGHGRKAGAYRRSIRPRGTRVVIGDPFWHLVEYGSQNNPPYAPARRGVIAAGLRFEDHFAELA